MTPPNSVELTPTEAPDMATSAIKRGRPEWTPDAVERAEARSRLRSGNPLEGRRVIPSKAPLPLDAQREFRGWIVIVIIALILFGTFMIVAIISKTRNRNIIYAPTAEHIGAVNSLHEATGWEISQQAQWMVIQMETWTPGSITGIWTRMLPFLHPSLHEQMRTKYDELARTAAGLWQQRVSVPLGVIFTNPNAGMRTVAVFFDSIEFTGKLDGNRVITATVPRVAYITFVSEKPSKENPLGLVVTHYKNYDRDEWIARGFPDKWEKLRVPGEAK